MNEIDVSVLTVNYKTPDLTLRCIESVLKQQRVRCEMLVVDNASGDDNIAKLKTFADRIRLIENTENKGFGRANNQAFRESRGEYIFMLNPDAVCTTDQDIAKLVAFMEANPEVGLVGTRIVNNQGECHQTAWQHYPREDQSKRDFSELPGNIATVLGASMFVKREAFEAVGGFDEDYFLYAEETDLCLRLRRAGYKIAYFDEVTVQHLGGGSEHANPRVAVMRMKKAGKYLFYQKHYAKEAVRAMAQQELRQARLRLTWLRLKSLFKKPAEADLWRQERYTMIKALMTEVLARIPA